MAPPKNATPEKFAQYFFQALTSNQCHVAWGLFTKKSQDEFVKWTLEDIYKKNPEAAKAANLRKAEIRLLFENNDLGLIKSFWKRFYYSSNAATLYRYGWPQLVKQEGRKAIVRFDCRFDDGRRQVSPDISMINERGGWKLAYVESNLPF